MEAVSLIKDTGRIHNMAEQVPLAAETVECFRDEQLNFGLVWDKLICLHSHFTREAAPDGAGVVNAHSFLKILANVVSIKFKCGSSSLSQERDLKGNGNIKNKLKIYPKSLAVFQGAQHDYVVF